MRTLLERPCALVWAVLCPFIAAALDPVLHAATDSTSHQPEPSPRESVLFIGNLNFDCFPDTVTGTISPTFAYLPSSIRWGEPHLADSACSGAPRHPSSVAVTTFRYPDWEGFSGSVAFQRMNPDSLDDIVLYLHGRVGDSTHRRDTLRPLLIFGQQGLDTLPVLDVAAIEEFQATPFFAMELRMGTDLVEPDVRDLSGVTSYVLQPVDFAIGGRDTSTYGTPSPGDSTPAQTIRLRVYPNPTGGPAQIEVASIPPGEYSVEVVAVNGLVYLRQDLSVSMAGALFQTLDLHALPTGFYVVRVANSTGLFGLYPIIITR